MQNRKTPEGEARLWQRFKETGDKEARNKLVENYLPLVRHIASVLHPTLPLWGSSLLNLEDFVSVGTISLCSAVENFDPSRGAQFGTYAMSKIRGAMIDELRRSSSRLKRTRSRKKKIEEFLLLTGEGLSASELIERMGVTLKEFMAIQQLADCRDPVSLYGDPTLFHSGEDRDGRRIDRVSASWIKDRTGETPLQVAENRELHEIVEQLLMSRFTPRERKVLILYYSEELTMKQVGSVLRVSESRICQMISGMLARIIASLEPKSPKKTSCRHDPNVEKNIVPR